jgi:FkbM family methyltransferase
MFEPNPSLKKFTDRILSLNDLKSCHYEQICLSDTEGEATFYISSSSYMSSLDKENAAMDRSGDRKVTDIKVPVTTLDRYVEKNYKGKGIRIMKIDTEGFEYNVLKGGINVLKEYSPAVIAEILPHSKDKDAILQLFSELGYSVFALSDEENISTVYRLTDLQHIPKIGIANFLFTKDADLIIKIKKLPIYKGN